MGRNLIFLFDGSSNAIISPSRKVGPPTNMYYMNQMLSNDTKEGRPQVSFYLSGVGTHGDVLSAASAEGLDEIVVDAYTNLASNYAPGDKIYLFGFSRGATAARALSALVSNPGLLKDTRLVSEFPRVWEYYLALDPKRDRTYQTKLRLLREALGPSLWRREEAPQIEFMGVFDTVPGYDWDELKIFSELRIRDLRLESQVRNAVHILSMDDRRIPSFKPLLWESFKEDHQRLIQIWMPGVHGDVGGSGEGAFIGGVALLTMLDCIKALGVDLAIEEEIYRAFYHDTMNTYEDFVVSDELTSRSWGLARGIRLPHGSAKQQFRHELVDHIANKQVWKHGEQQIYGLDPAWMHLPLHTTTFSSDLRSAVDRMYHS